jgi:hypothetical protein
MITALEGGVSYWSVASDIVRHADNDLWYVSYVLTEADDDTADCSADGATGPCAGHRVDPDVVARGIGLLTSRTDCAPRLRLANRENDAGEIDAGDADAIVQFGIFGTTIYA